MRTKLLGGLALVLLLLGFNGIANATLISTFDANDESWQIVELPGPPYNVLANPPFAPNYAAIGGNPGGAIYTVDRSGNLFLFSAPSLFLGNQETFFGGRLTYDLRFVNDNLPPGFQHPDVVLWGNGQTLVIDSFQDPPIERNLWESYAVPLTVDAGWRFNSLSGTLATQDQIKAVLADLTGLYIRGDYFNGAEQVSLDNPSLNPGNTTVPEPASVVLMGAGIAGLAGIRLTKRRK